MTNEQQLIYVRGIRRRLESQLDQINSVLLENDSIPNRDLNVFMGQPQKRVNCLDELYQLWRDLLQDEKSLESDS